MPLVRGIRLFNAIESGSLDSAQLQTLLNADAGRVSELNGVFNSNGLARRAVASNTMTTTIAGSALAAQAFLESPIVLDNLLANPTYITKFQGVSNVPEQLISYYFQNLPFKEVTLPSTRSWNGLAFGNGTFVATAGWSSGTTDMAYSTNYGKTWTLGSMPISAIWHSVTFGNGRFVAVAGFDSTQNNAAYSTDGITWTAATLPASDRWSNVVYDSGNDRFVAIAGGRSGTSVLSAYSSDGGATWTSGGNLPSNQAWRACDYDPVSGRIIAVSIFNSSSASSAFSSDGGTNWSTGTSLPGSNPIGVVTANGKGKVVVTSGNDNSTGNVVYESINGGSNWLTPNFGTWANSYKRFGGDSLGDLFIFTQLDDKGVDFSVNNMQSQGVKNVSGGTNRPFANVRIGGGAVVIICGADSTSNIAYTNAV
jgi:hypothetical protein